MGTPLRVRTTRLAAAVAATIVAAGCGGDGLSCVDFDADDPPMVFLAVDVVALSEAVPDLPEGFENDPPVPAALTVESVSEVSAVEVGGGRELDVEHGVSVVMVGDLTTSDMIPIYRSLVGACAESGRAQDPGGEYESIVGFTGDRAVRFHVEDGRLIVSEYDYPIGRYEQPSGSRTTERRRPIGGRSCPRRLRLTTNAPTPRAVCGRLCEAGRTGTREPIEETREPSRSPQHHHRTRAPGTAGAERRQILLVPALLTSTGVWFTFTGVPADTPPMLFDADGPASSRSAADAARSLGVTLIEGPHRESTSNR